MLYLIIVILFLSSFLTSLLLVPLFRKLAWKKGVLDIPEERKIHRKPIPLLGGVAIFVSFYLVWGIGLLFLLIAPRFFPSFSPYLPPLSKEVSRLTPLFLSGTLMLLVGLRDDLKPLTPFHKIIFYEKD